jgi:tubulin polyglutamylase TTLL9
MGRSLHALQKPHQRVNHFRNHWELTRKDNLAKNVKKMRRLVSDCRVLCWSCLATIGLQLEKTDKEEASKYDFIPESFVLPAEYSLFVESFRRAPGTTWIMKPIGSAQGKGIFLFTKLSDITDWKRDHRWSPDAPSAAAYVVQRYIDRPYTVGGKKFDCRLYALVTSYSPLTVWIYREGFARFTSARYNREGAVADLRKSCCCIRRADSP